METNLQLPDATTMNGMRVSFQLNICYYLYSITKSVTLS